MAQLHGSRFRLRISEPGPGARRSVEDRRASCIWPRNPSPKRSCEWPSDADALLATYAKITADMIRQMKRCRIISRFGIGVDNVDIRRGHRARHRGHQGAGLLHRRSFRPRHGAVAGGGAQDPVRQCAWCRQGAGRCRAVVPIHRLRGSVLGLVGFGRIPQLVAPKAQVFRHARWWPTIPTFRKRFSNAPACESVEFRELLKISDYISIHSPLLPETIRLVQRGGLSADEAARLSDQYGARPYRG